MMFILFDFDFHLFNKSFTWETFVVNQMDLIIHNLI